MLVQDLTNRTAEIYHDLVFIFDRGATRSATATRRSPEAEMLKYGWGRRLSILVALSGGR